MNTLENLYKGNKDQVDYSKAYVSYLIDILNQLDHKTVARIIEIFQNVDKERKRVYFAGNGGSASTCGHFVNDLHAGSLRHGGGGFRLIDLTSNISSVTALANDLGYEEIFVRQIDGVMNPGDALVVISASGNSKNLVRAVECAKRQDVKTIGLLGFDGGILKGLCDLSLVVSTAQGQYGPVEDIHLILNHLISTFLTFSKKCNS